MLQKYMSYHIQIMKRQIIIVFENILFAEANINIYYILD